MLAGGNYILSWSDRWPQREKTRDEEWASQEIFRTHERTLLHTIVPHSLFRCARFLQDASHYGSSHDQISAIAIILLSFSRFPFSGAGCQDPIRSDGGAGSDQITSQKAWPHQIT